MSVTVDARAQRSELHHRLLQFLFSGKNYVGPVEDILTNNTNHDNHRRRVLDLGTGGGIWFVPS